MPSDKLNFDSSFEPNLLTPQTDIYTANGDEIAPALNESHLATNTFQELVLDENVFEVASLVEETVLFAPHIAVENTEASWIEMTDITGDKFDVYTGEIDLHAQDWKIVDRYSEIITDIRSVVSGENIDESFSTQLVDFLVIDGKDFMPEEPTIELTSFNDSDTFELGESIEITWSDNFEADVSIILLDENDILIDTIASQTASDGSYEWTVPTNLPASDRYKIKVSSVGDDAIADLSDNYFAIESSDLKKFWFDYNYLGGNSANVDSYHGYVIAPFGKYTLNQTYNHRTSDNEIAADGTYSIYKVEEYNDDLIEDLGKVFVDKYYDRDNPAAVDLYPVKTFALEDNFVVKEFIPFKYRNEMQPAGTNYLGSELDYIEDEGYITNRFGQDYYEADSVTFPENRWKAEYFNGHDFSQAPVLVEDLGEGTDNLSLQWNLDSPASEVNADNFAARITTRRYLAPGLYQIQTGSDDGIRVIIDGQKVTDRWVDRGITIDSDSGYFYSTGKEHDIQIEYYEKAGGAALDFKIDKATNVYQPTDESQVWRASIFNWNPTKGNQPPRDFFAGDNRAKEIGSVGLGSNTRSDGKFGLAVNWEDGAINNDSRLPHDNFAIRAYTHKHLEAGKTYKLWARGDDGFQFFARQWHTDYSVNLLTNERKEPTQWEQNYEAAKPYEFTVDHTGWYDFTFHLYEGAGLANFDFVLEEPVDIATQVQSIAQQYNLGNSTSDLTQFNNEISYQTFDNGSVVSSNFGVYPLFGGIRQRFLDTGGLYGNLGAPKSGEYSWEDKVRQDFEGGYIVWNGSSAQEYYGSLGDSGSSVSNYLLPQNYLDVWNQYKGTIGNPTSEVIQFSGNTSYQVFQSGSIVSSEHGTYPLFGGIRQRYLETGGLYGNLGAPKSGEYTWEGKTRQDFANGQIIWNGSSAQEYYGDGSNITIDNQPPASQITQINFSGWVMPSIGVAIRNSPRLSDKSGDNIAYQQTISFDGWTTGETAIDTQLGTPDNRWFRISGTDTWVPSAYIFGNPEGYPTISNPENNSGSDNESNTISSNLNYADFTGWVMPSIGVALRNSPRLSDKSGDNIAYQQTLEFDAWTTGETVTDFQLGTPDSRWFRVKGTNYWVPSAYIYGNPLGLPNNEEGKEDSNEGNNTVSVPPITPSTPPAQPGENKHIVDFSLQNQSLWGWGNTSLFGGWSPSHKLLDIKSYVPGFFDISLESKIFLETFVDAGTFSTDFSGLFDFSNQANSISGSNIELNVSNISTNSNNSLKSPNLKARYGAGFNFGIDASFDFDFARWINALVPDVKLEPANISFDGIDFITNSFIPKSIPLELDLDFSLQGDTNEFFGNSLIAKDDALNIVKGEIPGAEIFSIFGGLNFKAETELEIAGFEIDYDNVQNGNEVTIHPNQNDELSINLDNISKTGNIYSFTPTVTPITTMTVSLTPEFAVGGELNIYKTGLFNKLPNDVRDRLDEIIGFGSSIQYQFPIHTFELSKFDPFKVANYSYRLPEVSFTV